MRIASAVIGFLFVVAIGAGTSASAQTRGAPEAFSGSRIPVPGRYATTGEPYWRVGNVSKPLSLACQRGNFNQIEYYRLNIAYRGRQGAGVTGIATKEWNLRDPGGLAENDVTYHFFNDGYSNCKVYAARRKGR